MAMVNQRDVPLHVSVVGWLFVIGNALFLVIGAFVFLLLTGLGLSLSDVEARSVLLIVGPTLGLLLVALALPGLAAGYGLLTRKPWARILGIVMAIIGLVNFPVGTLIGLYALWVLVPEPTRDYFGAASSAAT